MFGLIYLSQLRDGLAIEIGNLIYLCDAFILALPLSLIGYLSHKEGIQPVHGANVLWSNNNDKNEQVIADRK